MSLVVVPTTFRVGRAWLAKHHSHLGPPTGWLFGVAVNDDGRLCCVAAVERPARLLQDGATACVSRVASDGTPHAASKAIAAVSRAALALGYRRLVSYTLLGEAGTCYRAAGWWVTALSAGGEHSRPSRRRKPAEQPGPKARWEFGPDAAPRDAEAERAVAEHVGRVALTTRAPGGEANDGQARLFGDGEAAA